MMLLRITSASPSEVILGVFLVLTYAGDSNAFTADLPNSHMQRYKGAEAVVLQGRGLASLTFEIVNSLAIQDPDPVLESRLTTAEKIHDIPYVLWCLLLLFGGRHACGPAKDRLRYRGQSLPAYVTRCSQTTRMQLSSDGCELRPHTHGGESVVLEEKKVLAERCGIDHISGPKLSKMPGPCRTGSHPNRFSCGCQ